MYLTSFSCFATSATDVDPIDTVSAAQVNTTSSDVSTEYGVVLSVVPSTVTELERL